jgi:hypothetical protein
VGIFGFFVNNRAFSGQKLVEENRTNIDELKVFRSIFRSLYSPSGFSSITIW